MKLYSKRKRTLRQKIDGFLLWAGLNMMHNPKIFLIVMRSFHIFALCLFSLIEYSFIMNAIYIPAWRETNIILAILFGLVLWKIVSIGKMIWSKSSFEILSKLDMGSVDGFLEGTLGTIMKKKKD